MLKKLPHYFFNHPVNSRANLQCLGRSVSFAKSVDRLAAAPPPSFELLFHQLVHFLSQNLFDLFFKESSSLGDAHKFVRRVSSE